MDARRDTVSQRCGENQDAGSMIFNHKHTSSLFVDSVSIFLSSTLPLYMDLIALGVHSGIWTLVSCLPTLDLDIVWLPWTRI